ncbi:hypothetical protein B9T16_14405 [Arthrospira sp. PCC 8006]
MGWSGVRIPYIPPRGGSPTRRLFKALQPYFTPKRLAHRRYPYFLTFTYPFLDFLRGICIS